MAAKIAILVVAVCLIQYFYMRGRDAPVLGDDWETSAVQSPTQGFVISMHNDTGWKVAERTDNRVISTSATIVDDGMLNCRTNWISSHKTLVVDR